MNNLVTEARKASRDPKDCLKTIETLQRMGFSDETFSALHHQGGSVTQFTSYSRGVGKFEEDGNNHRIHQRLMYVLLSCADGASPKGNSFQTLVDEARQQIRPIE